MEIVPIANRTVNNRSLNRLSRTLKCRNGVLVQMRLSIKWQLALVSVALSLLLIVVVGVVAYRSARGALEDRIRFNLETLASQTDEKLNRLLLDRQQNLKVWSQLGFMRDDAVTGDADGRVLQFLQEAKRNSDL